MSSDGDAVVVFHFDDEPVGIELAPVTELKAEQVSKKVDLSPPSNPIVSTPREGGDDDVVDLAHRAESSHLDLSLHIATSTSHSIGGMALSELAASLDTDLRTGLSVEEAARRAEKDGPNQLSPSNERSLFMKFVIHLFSGFGPLLWTASLLCVSLAFTLIERPSALLIVPCS